MTWKEFKEIVEEHGVKDNDKIYDINIIINNEIEDKSSIKANKIDDIWNISN